MLKLILILMLSLVVGEIQAAKHIHLGRTDTEGRWTVFGQAFRQVHTAGNTTGAFGRSTPLFGHSFCCV